jgi:hypothetical protein
MFTPLRYNTVIHFNSPRGKLGYESIMVKVKTSVAIDSELVKWIDKLIDSKRFANRSHAVEFALKRMQECYEKEGKF